MYLVEIDMWVKQVIFFKVKWSITYQIFVERKMVQYLGGSTIMQTDSLFSGAEENIILYPIEQIVDQGKADRNKSLRLKRASLD